MVAFYLPGGIAVYTFSLLVGLGAALGLAWVLWQAPPEKARVRFNAALCALVGALIGGRASFVIGNWAYYSLHPGDIPLVSLGGLGWPGALAGGLIALAVYARLSDEPLGSLADSLLPLLALVSVSAWLACWLDGCAYGSAATSLGLPAPDEWGQVALRFPVQLIGAVLALAAFALVERLKNSPLRPGTAAWIGLFALAAILFGLSFLRADPVILWHRLRPDAWAALIFGGISLLALLFVPR